MREAPRTSRLNQAGVGLSLGALAGLVALDLELLALVSFWGDRSFLVPASAVVGALLGLTPLRRLVVWAAGLLLVLWLAVAYTPLTTRLAEGLVRRDEPQAADAVFVFGSGIQEDGDPSVDSMSRLLRGVELVAEGRSDHLVVSEIPPPQGRSEPIARAWLGRFARRGEVLAVGPVRNTRDEALAVARLFRERGWRKVLAVTSPTHSRRASASLEQQGLDVVSVPSVETQFDEDDLDKPAERRRAFGFLAHEQVGLIVYRRRGWIE